MTGEEGADVENYIGVVSGGVGKRRSLTSPEPPPAFGVPYVFLVDDSKGLTPAESPKLAQLYRNAPTILERKLEWMVGIPPSSEATILSVNGLGALPEDLDAYWMSGNRIIDLRKRNMIAIRGSTTRNST